VLVFGNRNLFFEGGTMAFSPISLNRLLSGEREEFRTVGEGKLHHPSARRFFIAESEGGKDPWIFWLPEAMPVPPGKFLLVRYNGALIAVLFAPEGKVRVGDLVVILPNGSVRPWFTRLSYIVVQGDQGETATLVNIDGQAV
jgi:hypothetical protein